jgi:transcriptional regulator with XRE-family HTH domain
MGARLRAMHADVDVLGAELCAAAGIASGFLSALEAGQRRARMGTLTRLAGALAAIEPAVGDASALLAELVSIDEGAGVAPNNPHPEHAKRTAVAQARRAQPIEQVRARRALRRAREAFEHNRLDDVAAVMQAADRLAVVAGAEPLRLGWAAADPPDGLTS